MAERISAKRVIINIIIALGSAGVVYPIIVSAVFGLDFLISLDVSIREAHNLPPHCYLNAEFCRGFLVIAGLWGMIIVAFWAFVLANKLWPVKVKAEGEK